MIVTGEQLHIWYLEAVANLRPESFNPNAQKPYSELTEEQRSIDEFIAGKIRQRGEELERENTGLRADRERIDRMEAIIKGYSWRDKSWLVRGNLPKIVCAKPGKKWPEGVTRGTLREALDDAARKAEEGE